MVIPFLFTMGFCALTHATHAHAMQMTDPIPQERRVQVQHLSNGIKIFLQENERSSHLGSIRVVVRSPHCNEILYTYEGRMENLDQIEQFFVFCINKISGAAYDHRAIPAACHYTSSKMSSIEVSSLREMAVIAVGDFAEEQMLALIEKHFGQFLFNPIESSAKFPGTIQIDTDAAIQKVAMSVSFPNSAQSIQTYSDLKESWKFLMLQELYQQRLERCSRGLDEVWIHPHPHFFYPVEGYSFASEEISENLLSLILWQAETILSEGFAEEEFLMTKRKMLNQLQYLSSRAADPDNAFLASYYTDQFLLGDRCLCYEPFLAASVELVEEIEFGELFSHIPSFFAENKRSIRVVYPEIIHVQGLTKDDIEAMIERISSLSSFYQDSETPEEKVWMLEDKNNRPSPQESWIRIDEDMPQEVSPVVLVNNREAIPFRLANNAPVVAVNESQESVDSFYQLPLNDKEKRLIKAIFTTMAEKNIIQLALEKRTMEKKGKKVNQVHPMRFIGYIFANSDLKSCMRKIVKSSFKWDAFVDGFSRRMKEEYSNNNLYRHIPGFCKEVGANPDDVAHYIEKKDWEGLVKYLL